MSKSVTDVIDYFDVSGDLSKVTWGHAINSKIKLLNSLNDDKILMLEADILMGHIEGHEDEEKIPIMAHPPSTTSDISLESWLRIFINTIKDKKIMKGIKLDFKELLAAEESMKILENYKDRMDFPLLLNADILVGPGDPENTPVDADKFLCMCAEYFPLATLSVGWTTKYISATDSSGAYSDEMAKEMITKLTSNGIGQPVTFPIRAAFVPKSVETLIHLIDNVEDSTITIWSSITDSIDVDALVELRNLIGHDVIYFDLPGQQAIDFDLAKNKSDLIENKPPGNGVNSFITSPYITICIVILILAHMCMTISTSLPKEPTR